MPLRRIQSPPAASVTPIPDEPADLVAVLDEPSPERRRLAALSLDGNAEAIPRLLERVPVEEDPAVRQVVLTTLAAFDSDTVVAGLVPHLSSENATLRTAVAEALATMTTATLLAIPDLVADPDPDVRIMTAMVLADLAHPQAAWWLTELVTGDRHPNVVASAIDALLPMAGPDHVPALEAVRERFPDDPFLRFTIENALPKLRQVSR
jgi:HEAT repeat protein